NASLPSDVSGSEPNNGTTADFIRNVLGARDFDILKLNIVAPTANPVTAIPSSLIANVGLDSTQVSVTRALKITLAGNACPDPSTKCSWFNKQLFDMNRIDYKVNQDATEIWEITNSAPLAHPFHIHDVSFKILSKSNGPLEDYEKGWKDVVLVRKGATVRFIAKFSDYADSTHPYMYHCHISSHADEGMMGQFVVMPPSNTPPAISIADAKKTEGNSGTSQMNFTVSLSSPYTGAVTIKYKTKDATAVAASDYIAASGTLTFNAGETFKTISVAIIGDVSPEANETFKVTLSNPVNATIADGSAKGTITNDDGSMAVVGANKSNATINSDIKIFPNPVTNGLANISISRIYTKPLHVIITDANGRILSTQTIAANSNSYKADVSKLKDGIYFIAVLNGKTLLHKQTIQLMH
ncbi:MAG TPA: multicopper oxidase domain-containing protein, partial [Chitinophagaceae bacterium]|nr:multicopper oxidase domain-containing protein [Chitinophagaceae bacterium]